MNNLVPHASAATTVVVHCGSLPAARVERRLRAVVASVPPDTCVHATVLAPVKLTPGTGRRVQITVIDDGGMDLVQKAVRGSGGVIVIPFEATVAAGWFAAVEARWRVRPHEIGVVRCGSGHVMAYPPAVVELDAPRLAWSALPGVSTRGGSTASTPRLNVQRSLSAVLIVKDEEHVIARCLASLTPLVDEIIVYDTGSSDCTVALARELGAVVVEGFWDHDFGAARTRALAHATGDWVLSVDADEEAEADRPALRAFIDSSEHAAHLVSVISLSFDSAEGGVETNGPRLFRRKGASWSGVLHEVPVSSDGCPLVPGIDVPPLRLIHTGYTPTAMQHKRGRNSLIVEQALASMSDDAPGRADLTAHLVRSYVSDDRIDEGLALAAALVTVPAVPANMLLVARVVVPHFLSRHDPERARLWIDIARDSRESSGQCAVWSAALLVEAGQMDLAAAELRRHLGTAAGVDFWNTACDPTSVPMALAEVEVLRGDAVGAAALVLEVLAKHPETISLRGLLTVLHATGYTMGDLISIAPAAFVSRSLRDVQHMSAEYALLWCAALLEADPLDVRPLVAGAVVARRNGLHDAAEWEAHARQRGLVGVHPLRDFASDDQQPVPERILAWVLVSQAFGDADAEPAAQLILDHACPEDAERAVALLQTHAPEALQPA